MGRGTPEGAGIAPDISLLQLSRRYTIVPPCHLGGNGGLSVGEKVVRVYVCFISPQLVATRY